MTSFSFVKINNEKINPILGKGIIDEKKIRGYKLFPSLFYNIALIGKKRSGKTSVIAHILDKITGRRTKVIIFSSTINKDKTWDKIKENLDKKNIAWVGETSTEMLEDFIKELENPEDVADISLQSSLKGDVKYALTDEDAFIQKETKSVKLKEKLLSSDYIIVYDDVSTELRSNILAHLLKRNRHFKITNIISTQWATDIHPSSLKQLDYVLLFPSIPLEKLEHMYKLLDVPISFDKFVEIYKKATEKPFNFLYYNTSKDEFRKNFNQKFQLH